VIPAGVGAANLLMGLLYFSVAALTIAEMVKGRDQRAGFSTFGVAWIALLLTCGMHHWVHGLHTSFEGRNAGALDLIAVLVGMPAGLLWVGLRVEAFRGGAGDRFVPGNPTWVGALPTLFGIYLTALGAAAVTIIHTTDSSQLAKVIPNAMLVGLYFTLAVLMARAQVHNRKPLGGWSASGLALVAVFVTCAAMHAVYVVSALGGIYGPDAHGVGVDWVSVPVAMYFLWVIHGLNKGTLRDWNSAPSMLAEQRTQLTETP